MFVPLRLSFQTDKLVVDPNVSLRQWRGHEFWSLLLPFL